MYKNHFKLISVVNPRLVTVKLLSVKPMPITSMAALCRLAQTLNVYWEKTPESVLYAAVQAAVDSIGNVQLIDFTSTENVCLSHLPGKHFYSALA